MPKMSDGEIRTLLRRSPLVRIATTRRDGAPLVVPVAYLFQDQEILLTARGKVSWLANIRRDPRVCLSIDESRYPLSKVTIQGVAEIRHEPGEDDLWRDRRLPLAPPGHVGPVGTTADGREEWMFAGAYHLITHDEPRALVAIPLDGARVTSWRMPIEGESLDGVWASEYFDDEPVAFRVIETGPTLADVRVVKE